MIENADQQVLSQLTRWIEAGKKAWLATVVKTWGSSPRPVGSLMLMHEDGRLSGSVSGGCVEEDLLVRYRDHQLGDSFPTLIDYGINREEATRLGLPCGGRLELLIEQLDSTTQLQTLLDKIKASELVARRVCLTTGEVSLHPALAGDDFYYTDTHVKKTFGPRWQILLIGAGHLSEYVAQIALMMNYRIIICDPRESAIDRSVFDGCEIVNSMPDDAVRTYVNHKRSVVVALTHDPKLDDMALLDALVSPAFYVGSIGSKLNCEKRRERLKSLGITAQQLQRLHAPVGLPIGSHSPPEIAVSIMAEITSLRHQAKQHAQHAISAA